MPVSRKPRARRRVGRQAVVAVLLLGCGPVVLRAQAPGFGLAADGTRREYLLNDGWQYLERNPAGPELLERFAAEWRPVALPHTWNAFDATDAAPGYRRDAGWYRRDLAVGDTAGARYLLHFEGANISTDVFVNGHRAGGHAGGYVGFDVELTPWLAPRARNRIEVRVDNRVDQAIIPSQKSDFFIYGGITRDVWLRVLPAAHIAALRIHTPRVGATRAQVALEIEVRGRVARGGALEAVLVAPDGRVVARALTRLALGDSGAPVRVVLPALRDPVLWSPDAPALYRATVRLRQGDAVLDEFSDRFGLRWFEFVAGGPFLLNGRRLPLRGTHWHEDYAGLGAALPDSLRRRDLERIKAMGANFVRLAHYPQDPVVYRAADELGLLVWDELPWCRGGVGDSAWQATTRQLLAEQIRQNFNHPSIIIWSLGNEIDWLPDFAGGDDTARVDGFLRELNRLAHQLDPARLTALRKYPGAVPVVDVFSPSIWAGWYSGVYADYRKALEASRQLYPRFVHMEFGGDSHVGRHTESPIDGMRLVRSGEWEEAAAQVAVRNIAQDGDWSESYIVDLMDWYLTAAEGLDWFTGHAQWAFKDFGTPLRPENPIPYVNQKGLLDRAGNPKDAWYVFRSHWSRTPFFTWIESHSWTERSGPAGQPRTVRVWSNCSAVELLLDGVSQGERTRTPADFPAQGLRWAVTFAEGANRLASRCRDDAQAADSLVVNFTSVHAGTADHVELSAHPLVNGNLLIEAIAVDARGRRALDYDRRIYFAHDGAGRLLTGYGTPTRSDIIEMANGRAAIEFVPGPGRAIIEARNQDFKGAYLVIPGT
ncbi:MAG: glycoside hydrolase family 2 protein [Gemmatimonadetes bacterium]|nr:glycoside hydrolase family 2 protein [Gemmatimonadota bacterium]